MVQARHSLPDYYFRGQEIVKIGPSVRSVRVTKKPKKKDRNLTVANWVFAETTHVVGSK